MPPIDSPKELLKKLKSLPLDAAQIRVFFVRPQSRLEGGLKSATIISVKAKDRLKGRILGTVTRRLRDAKAVRDYEPETTDLDDDLLVAGTEESHWADIGDNLSNPRKVKAATKSDDIKGASFMLAEFTFDDHAQLWVATKLPAKLTPRRMSLQGAIFSQGELEIVKEDSKLLEIDFRVDFMAYGGSVFVADKKGYESIMNIRQGMIRKKDAFITEIRQSERFDGVEHLEDHVKTNAVLLRRVSKAADSGNVSDAEFFVKLLEVVKNHPGFEVETDGRGRVIITPKNADTILHLLSDSRALTLIKERLMDIHAGREVRNGSGSAS